MGPFAGWIVILFLNCFPSNRFGVQRDDGISYAPPSVVERYKFSFGAKERFNTDVTITRMSLRRAVGNLVRRLRPIWESCFR
jgi:hypothetical protein